MLTPEQYVARGGSVCPVCHSADIEGQDVDVDNGKVFQECSCNSCEAEWIDVYELVRYDKLQVFGKALPATDECSKK